MGADGIDAYCSDIVQCMMIPCLLYKYHASKCGIFTHGLVSTYLAINKSVSV